MTNNIRCKPLAQDPREKRKQEHTSRPLLSAGVCILYALLEAFAGVMELFTIQVVNYER